MMNYIKEINAFYQKIETTSLSTGAGMLWHTLIHINNRAYWVKEFSVAAVVLCYKSGLSESSFKRARTELCEKGFITHRSRGTKAPIYKMISLVNKGKNSELDEVVSQVADQAPNQVVSPLYKQDKNKQKETVTSRFENGDLYKFYCDNFKKPTTYIRKELMTWSKEVGEELVYESLKRALENNKPVWRYAKGILKKWQKDQLRTVADVLVAEERYRDRRLNKKSVYNAEVPQEIVPDWFRELKEKEREERELQGVR